MSAQVASEEFHQHESFHLQTSTISYPTPNRRLEGKVAIITGGAGGIGEAIVRLFATHGAKVVIADVMDTLGATLANSLSPTSVSYVHCNVSVEDDVENLIATTMSHYGRVDVFINNAGILGQQKRKSIMEFDGGEFDNIIGVNVKGMALCTKHAARVMVPKRTGCIISTASVAGVLGGCGPHSYSASKHAIVGLTKNVAAELGKYGIRVNCISPFGVATPMLVNAWYGDDEEDAYGYSLSMKQKVEKTEEFVRDIANLKGATLRAQDIAEAALYLASDESRYISGHNLVIDGGFTTSKNCVGL